MNPERPQSETAFAALCGVSPVEASSGQTTRGVTDRRARRSQTVELFTDLVVTRVGDTLSGLMFRSTSRPFPEAQLDRIVQLVADRLGGETTTTEPVAPSGAAATIDADR